MSQALHAKCPGCGNVLRVPTEWIGRALRCKHCGATVQAKVRSNGVSNGAPSPAPPPPVPLAMPLASASATTTVNSAAPFAFDIEGSTPPPLAATDGELGIRLPGSFRRRRSSPWRTAIIAIILCALFGGGVTALILSGGVDRIRANLASTTETPSDKEKPSVPPVHLPKAESYPRRLLAVGVSNYWYANPVTYGEDMRGLDGVIQKLAEAFHVPSGQFALLSDGAPQPIPPTRALIQKTVSEFLNTSRPADRIVLLFVGHAVTLDKHAYLVPIDGELKAKATLIPLNWLYGELAKCKAKQKVLIADLCRYDPGRGSERPGSGPMDKELANELKHPPDGVQVWSACSAGEYSYEGQVYLGDGTSRHVGFFLNEWYEAVGPTVEKHLHLMPQKPGDPLPLDVFAHGDGKAPGVLRGTTQQVRDWLDVPQTPFVAGQEPAGGPPYDPNATEPPQLVLHRPAPPAGQALADARMLHDILHETGEDLNRNGSPPLNPVTMPFFNARLAQTYKDDGKDTPLRDAVRKADQLLKKHAGTFNEEFQGAADKNVKKAVRMKQYMPARAIAEIESMLADLEAAKTTKPREKSKRWKADAEFVTAKLEARRVYLYQYDLMLAKILKDQLPHPKNGKSSGLRLAAQEKLDIQSGQEWKKRAADSRKLFLKITKTYKGTPWEFLAKREALTALGLSWQPLP
jgi:hypothetical protein